MEYDNRIPKNFQLYLERRRRSRERVKNSKNTISHEKILKSKTAKNARIQRGIRVSIDSLRQKSKGGLVCIHSSIDAKQQPTDTISHLLNTFPETVETGFADDNGNPTYLPFNLPAWRDLNERIRPYFYQLTLLELETQSNHEQRLIPFVFNESEALTIAFNSQKRERVDFLRDRLQKALSEALKRPVLFWFAFETARRGQPHIQGSLLLRPDELKKAQTAFYKINRQMTPREKHGALRFRGGKYRRHAEKHGPLYAALNWADYNLKERATTRLEYGIKTIVAVSLPLKTRTADYYDRLRGKFIQQRISHN